MYYLIMIVPIKPYKTILNYYEALIFPTFVHTSLASWPSVFPRPLSTLAPVVSGTAGPGASRFVEIVCLGKDLQKLTLEFHREGEVDCY